MYTKSAQSIERTLTNLMGGQLADKVSVVTIIGTAYRYVGLSTTVNYIEVLTLNKTFLSRRREPQHYLAHCYNFCHFLML